MMVEKQQKANSNNTYITEKWTIFANEKHE